MSTIVKITKLEGKLPYTNLWSIACTPFCCWVCGCY